MPLIIILVLINLFFMSAKLALITLLVYTLYVLAIGFYYFFIWENKK